MSRTRVVLTAIASLVVGLAPRATEVVRTAELPAVSGTVASAEEGSMEGVLVSARRAGANFTVSVVTDANGRFAFPRSRLDAGSYGLSVRAIGYDLADRASVEVTVSKPATVALTLRKTNDLAAQLTSFEWTMSMPGTVEQKDKLVYQALSCAYCHSYRRIMRSKHSADEFVRVIARMQSYYPDGTASSDDGRGAASKKGIGDSDGLPGHSAPNPTAANATWGGVPVAELAQYLSTVNLSDGKTTWSYPLKSLPRPRGKATRVVITQWDLPRRNTVPHDMDVDSKGIVWYADESAQMIGKLDPKTNTLTEYPLPPVSPGHVAGTRDIQVDQSDRVWFPMRVAGGASVLTRFDPQTKRITTVNDAAGQFLALDPRGTIWIGFIRVDPKTAKVDKDVFPSGHTFRWNNRPSWPPGLHGGYQLVVNSKGNPYIGDFLGSYIVGVDASTGVEKFWPTPTRNAMPRRGRMDSHDRFWFGEYTGDRIGMFDTRSERFREWPLAKYTTPYTASIPDRNGHVWAPSNMAERLSRLNPETGEIVEYLMPTEFDSKKIAFDPTTDRVTLWMANTRNARLLRVEPLD